MRYFTAALVTGALFVIIGYFTHAAQSGVDGAYPFDFWISKPLKRGVPYWFIAGCVAGIGTRYSMTRR